MLLTSPCSPESRSVADTWATDVPISAPSGTVASYVDDRKKGTLSFTSEENKTTEFSWFWPEPACHDFDWQQLLEYSKLI